MFVTVIDVRGEPMDIAVDAVVLITHESDKWCRVHFSQSSFGVAMPRTELRKLIEQAQNGSVGTPKVGELESLGKQVTETVLSSDEIRNLWGDRKNSYPATNLEMVLA